MTDDELQILIETVRKLQNVNNFSHYKTSYITEYP